MLAPHAPRAPSSAISAVSAALLSSSLIIFSLSLSSRDPRSSPARLWPAPAAEAAGRVFSFRLSFCACSSRSRSRSWPSRSCKAEAAPAASRIRTVRNGLLLWSSAPVRRSDSAAFRTHSCFFASTQRQKVTSSPRRLLLLGLSDLRTRDIFPPLSGRRPVAGGRRPAWCARAFASAWSSLRRRGPRGQSTSGGLSYLSWLPAALCPRGPRACRTSSPPLPCSAELRTDIRWVLARKSDGLNSSQACHRCLRVASDLFASVMFFLAELCLELHNQSPSIQ